jgi:NAD-dependent SIR2 family protein deacetylase
MNLEKKKDRNGDCYFIAHGSDKEFTCCYCGKQLFEGFICENSEKSLCSSCQKEFPMSRCIHDINGEHKHIKLKRAP